MPDPVDLKLDWLGDVMTDQLKAGVANPLRDVLFSACEVIVETEHLFSSFHQAVTEMRPQQTSPTGNQIASWGCWHLVFRMKRMMR
jgi:hypothetical protein